MKKINYTGSSTIIKRLCEIVNELVDGGGSTVTSVNTKTGDVVLTTSDLQNDSGYITNVVNDLTNYYLKSETYTKTEVNNLIGTFVDIRVVSSLPTSDISRTTIYLVPKSVAQTNNLYDEYINLDGTSQGWEKIGDTQIDLSNYIQKSQTSGLVKNDGTIDTNTYSTTDENVKQTASSGNYDFRVLFSATATDGDYTGVVKKNTNLRYNASTGNFQVPKINGVDVGSAPEFTDIKVLYGTCSTAASDSDKKVVLSGTTLTDAQYSSLPIGTFLAVKYDNTNSASNCTLSIVDDATNPTKYTTPASFYYNTGVVTDSNTNVCGVANRHTYYIWNGTYWVWCTRGLETTFSNMSKSELVTGTATTQRTVRADYLNGGIQDLISQYAWATKNTTPITATSESHADLNDYKTPGNYSSLSSSVSQYIDNAPTTSAGFNLIVVRLINRDDRIRQIAIINASSAIYTRHCSGDNWTSWVNISQDTTYGDMSQSELVTGTATTQRSVRADHLNPAIRELIRKFGWGTQGAQAITGTSEAHEDLNTYTTPGNYTCTSNANAAYVDNKPTGSTNTAFNLIVIKTLNSNSYIRQVAWTYNAIDFYIRYSKDSGSTWSAWGNLNTPKYLTEMNTSSVSSITNSPGNYKANIENIVSSATTGLFPAADNSNAILQVNRMNGNYDSQLGFSSNGELYYRSFNNEALNTTKYWGRILKEYRFVKSQTDYAYFYFSLPSANAIWFEINGMYYGQFSRSVICMETWQSLWAPTQEPQLLSWGEGAATKAWVGKTNNVPWIAVDTKATVLNVKVYSTSTSEGVTIIDYQHNATNPTSASDEYRGSNKISTSSELYPDSPKVVRNKSSDTFLYNYDIKRVFIQAPYSYPWDMGTYKDITSYVTSAIGNINIRILSSSVCVYDVTSSEFENYCGSCVLDYMYDISNSQVSVSVKNNTGLNFNCNSGSYVTILLEYIEL